MKRLLAGRSPDTSLIVAVVLPMLCACTAVAPVAVDPALEFVVLRELPMPPEGVAACLRDNARRISHPRGVDPYVMARVPAGDGLVIEQWFAPGRHGEWLTRYELLPIASGRTEVRVRMETALTVSHGYARAARQLVAYCAGD